MGKVQEITYITQSTSEGLIYKTLSIEAKPDRNDPNSVPYDIPFNVGNVDPTTEEVGTPYDIPLDLGDNVFEEYNLPYDIPFDVDGTAPYDEDATFVCLSYDVQDAVYPCTLILDVPFDLCGDGTEPPTGGYPYTYPFKLS